MIDVVVLSSLLSSDSSNDEVVVVERQILRAVMVVQYVFVLYRRHRLSNIILKNTVPGSSSCYRVLLQVVTAVMDKN
jgi:hypothetical protein